MAVEDTAEPANIPWYRSKVYVGIVVSILSQLVVLVGKQDVVPVEMINSIVEGVFQLIALGALGVAEWGRRKSTVQPITLRQHKEQQ